MSRGKSGFTLIEMLLAVAVMMVLVAMGMARYSAYSLQMKQKAAITRIRQAFQEARANAMAGKMDCNVCGGLDHECNGVGDLAFEGWALNFPDEDLNDLVDDNTFTMRGRCGNTPMMAKSEVLPTRVVRDGPCVFTQLIFSTAGTTGLNANTCTLSAGDYCVEVGGSGAIRECN